MTSRVRKQEALLTSIVWERAKSAHSAPERLIVSFVVKTVAVGVDIRSD